MNVYQHLEESFETRIPPCCPQTIAVRWDRTWHTGPAQWIWEEQNQPQGLALGQGEAQKCRPRSLRHFLWHALHIIQVEKLCCKEQDEEKLHLQTSVESISWFCMALRFNSDWLAENRVFWNWPGINPVLTENMTSNKFGIEGLLYCKKMPYHWCIPEFPPISSHWKWVELDNMVNMDNNLNAVWGQKVRKIMHNKTEGRLKIKNW